MEYMGSTDARKFLAQVKCHQNRFWNRLLRRPVQLSHIVRALPWVAEYTTCFAQNLHALGYIELGPPIDGEIKVKLTKAGIEVLAPSLRPTA